MREKEPAFFRIRYNYRDQFRQAGTDPDSYRDGLERILFLNESGYGVLDISAECKLVGA